jgi:hypothetical protein
MEYIYHIDNHLPKDLCEKMIEKFESDSRVEKSVVGRGDLNHTDNNCKNDDTIRKSDILCISGLEGWEGIDSLLEKNLKDGLVKYRAYLNKLFPTDIGWVFDTINSDSGYQIQRMKKDDFYTWHVDEFINPSSKQQRVMTAMWYLNTLEEDDGGVTEFWMKKGIRPKQGTLLFFPSNWSYIHRGGIITNDVTKYTCITWLVNVVFE